MTEVYTELFRIPFVGEASYLRTQLQGLVGVESVSLGTTYEVIETGVDCEIQYNPHETDRTLIAEQIESIEGTGSVTFA